VNPCPATTGFAPTRWTLVLRSQGQTPEARAALSELCEAYYRPVLRFLRREGYDEDGARELVQEFFARVLSRCGFEEAAPEKGRFRSYLLGALKHCLADQRKRERALKRGAGRSAESLELLQEEEGLRPTGLPEAVLLSPEASFDREWALEIMARALSRLQQEFASDEKSAQFEALKPWLMGETPVMPQADAARRLGLTEGAVKVLVHRLRKRFRNAVRQEISQTLRDPALVDEELQHLILALS